MGRCRARIAGARADRTDGGTASLPAAVSLASGTYTFAVAGVGTATGEYRFALKDLAEAVPIADGAAVSGTLAQGDESDLYGIEVQAGERLEVAGLDVEGASGFDVQVRITGPYGREVFDSAFDSLLRGPGQTEILSEAGTYLVSVEGERLQAGAVDYSFSTTRIAAPDDDPLQSDETPIGLARRAKA
jgi:hypothetical protein